MNRRNLINVLVVCALLALPLWAVVNIAGNIYVAGSQICFEGSTDDAFETCIVITNPTADRNWTVGDVASDTFVGLAATQTLTNKTIDGENNTLQQRRAADCTAETGGSLGEFCVDSDDGATFVCVPSAGGCDTAGEWIAVGSGGDGRFPADVTTLTEFNTWQLEDDFHCSVASRLGSLDWQNVGNTGTTGCNTTYPGGSLRLWGTSADTQYGIALSGQSGFYNGLLNDADANEWWAVARFRVTALAETYYKVGWGDDDAVDGAGAVDHTANHDFVGVIFKDESTDTGGECAGTTGTSANWQFLVNNETTTSGLVNSTLAANTTNWLWLRIRRTATPGVEVCVDHTDSNPTWPSGQCYEETTAGRIPDANVGPMFVGRTCDGASGVSDGYYVELFRARGDRYE